MESSDKNQGEVPNPEEFAELTNSPYGKMARQMVRLTSGAQMRLGGVMAALEILRNLLDKDPEQLAALAAWIRSTDSEAAIKAVDPRVLAALKTRGAIRQDDTIAPDLAVVLDASLLNTEEGMVLRDPVIYQDRQAAADIEQHWVDHQVRFCRLLLDLPNKGPEGPGSIR